MSRLYHALITTLRCRIHRFNKRLRFRVGLLLYRLSHSPGQKTPGPALVPTALILLVGASLILAAILIPLQPREYPVQGLDVSHHRGVIDWERIPARYVFIYIKASEGATMRDPRFARNWRNARRHGFIPGAYHFFTLCRDGESQARNFIAAVPGEAHTLPPAVDLEFSGNCTRRPSAAQLMFQLNLFMRIVENHFQQRPVLYLTNNFRRVYGSVLPRDYPVWMSDVRQNPDYIHWQFWQHSIRASVAGIPGEADVNVFHGSSDQFKTFIQSGGRIESSGSTDASNRLSIHWQRLNLRLAWNNLRPDTSKTDLEVDPESTKQRLAY